MNSVEISSIVLSILFIPLFIYVAFEGDIKGFFGNYKININSPKRNNEIRNNEKRNNEKISKKSPIKKISPKFRKRLIPKI